MLNAFKLTTILLSLALLGGSWGLFATIQARLVAEQQAILAVARGLVYNEQFAEAIPHFDEAMGMMIGTDENLVYELATVLHSAGFFARYREQILTLIANETPPLWQGEIVTMADLYHELATFDLQQGSPGLAATVRFIREGLEATGDPRLFSLHEQYRYIFDTRMGIFDHATVIQNGAGITRRNELYGFVNHLGNNLIAPTFDMSTNFANNLAVVQDEDSLRVINTANQTQATADFRADSIANFGGVTFALRLTGENTYRLGTFSEQQLTYASEQYDFIGWTSEGIRVFRWGDLWALQDFRDPEIALPFEFLHEGFAVDELGRVAVNERMFEIRNGRYQMVDLALNPIGPPFDEARPFFETGGLAAVRQGNLWGFVNANGEVVIDFTYTNAKSSSENLAPVLTWDLWGYITVENFPPQFESHFGSLVIQPQFTTATQFVNGIAPVQDESGWFYIALLQ
ncbi:MAG: WG repeat-containing protein [Defluviitaleaceae bacterium]|nr:WG repeat-containing protein [Defluviitaleaceae bacterium]